MTDVISRLTQKCLQLEEENTQLRLRIAALTQGPTTDEQHALALHLAFRKASETKQTREWTDEMKAAWFILYEAITSDDFGLKLLAEKLCRPIM